MPLKIMTFTGIANRVASGKYCSITKERIFFFLVDKSTGDLSGKFKNSYKTKNVDMKYK